MLVLDISHEDAVFQEKVATVHVLLDDPKVRSWLAHEMMKDSLFSVGDLSRPVVIRELLRPYRPRPGTAEEVILQFGDD